MKKTNIILSYSGIDGSGKTSIIDGVSDALQKKGHKTRYIWLRYNHYFTKLLLVFCRLIGLTSYHTVDGVRIGHHDFYKSKTISYLFIFLTYIDTLITTFFLVYIPRFFTDTVIVCDRWVLDILIDLEIDTRLNLTNTFVSRIFLALIPADAKCFVIYRDYDSVLNARDDHKIDKNFERRYKLYYSESYERFQIINNTKSLDDVINEAINMVVTSD